MINILHLPTLAEVQFAWSHRETQETQTIATHGKKVCIMDTAICRSNVNAACRMT